MTLLELLIGMALTSLLAGVALSLFLIGRDSFLSALDEAALGRASYLAPRDIVAALDYTRIDSVIYAADQLAFATAYDEQGTFRTTPSGAPDWQAVQVFWIQNGKCRVGRRGYTGVPFALQLPASGKVLAEHVAALRVQSSGPAGLRVTLSIAYQGFRRDFQGEVSLCAKPVH
jgi:hypothetical protein